MIRLTEPLTGYFAIAIYLVLVVLILLLAKNMFRSRNITVECWFCSSLVEVSRVNEHSFVCVVCDQYNGFDPDGGYNKVIPEQHTLNKNHRHYYAGPGTFHSQSDVLCAPCTLKQSTLLQKLSAFEPKCEQRWNLELEEYKTYLEQLYPLCEICRKRSRALINDIDTKLLPSFLSWWTQVRCRISMNPRSPHPPRIDSPRFSDSPIPLPLCRLARGCSLLCFLTLIMGPSLSAFTQQHCLATVMDEHIIWMRLLHALNAKQFHAHVLPHCLALIEYSNALSLTPMVAFWFGLLFFLLQFVFLALHCKTYFVGKTKRPNPHWFLVDILVLVVASHFLVSTIQAVVPISNKSADQKSGWLHLVFVFGIVFVPLTITAVAGLVRWLLFCSADWQSQKQALKESWPLGGSSGPESEYSNHTFKKSTPSPVSSCSFSTVLPSTPHAGLRPASALTAWTTVSSKPLFRPSVLGGSQLSSRVTPTSCNGNPWSSRGVYTEPLRSATSLHMESDQSDANYLTSASCIHSNSRSSADGSFVSRKRHHRKRRRRSGLLRFLLSLLFGPVETLRDVLSELVCLMNAVLIGLVIYGTARLFMRLIEVY